MRTKVIATLISLTFSAMAPASAAETTYTITYKGIKAVTYTVADSVTLTPTGCKDVYIKYTIDKSFNFPNAYVMFGLYSKENNEAQSVYVKPGNGKGDQGKDPWVGDKEMVFCGAAKTFVNDYGDKVTAPAFAKGIYRFTARLTVLKPKLVTTQAKEIRFTVK